MFEFMGRDLNGNHGEGRGKGEDCSIAGMAFLLAKVQAVETEMSFLRRVESCHGAGDSAYWVSESRTSNGNAADVADWCAVGGLGAGVR
jgi:hypothetical protein